MLPYHTFGPEVQDLHCSLVKKTFLFPFQIHPPFIVNLWFLIHLVARPLNNHSSDRHGIIPLYLLALERHEKASRRHEVWFLETVLLSCLYLLIGHNYLNISQEIWFESGKYPTWCLTWFSFKFQGWDLSVSCYKNDHNPKLLSPYL